MNAPETHNSGRIHPRNYAWGVGGVADNLLTFGLAWTIIPVFNIGYGVNAFWLGVVIFVPRVIDVLTDPIMGVISDRTRSRFGRRRPYIFVGAILMAILFALLWMPPMGAIERPGDPG
ncbi:MAG TPA: MFS transporter, partial [Tepidisphaeraceae bacterium]|nr:MFS transporter [Tepidisphaeraceae bacterium]